MKTKTMATGFAVLAAALYAINVPLSKLLLGHVAPTMMAAFLYLGAGLGLLLYSAVGTVLGKPAVKEPLTKKELPYTIAMVVLDIAAPILLMLGIARTTSANVSLLNNFEIVATSLIALFVFKEVISKRLFAAILLVVVASVILGFEGAGSFSFQTGSLFVLGACICWGLENNCTKMISSKSSVEIVIIKGCCSGLGSLVIALATGEHVPALKWVLCVLLLGFVAYGLSIHQRQRMDTRDFSHGRKCAFPPLQNSSKSKNIVNIGAQARTSVACLCVLWYNIPSAEGGDL